MPRCGVLCAAMLLLAACAVSPQKDGLTYQAPKAAIADAAIVMPGESSAEAVAAVATRLRAAGLRVVKADRHRGTVLARSSGSALVDCGTFTQSARGNVVRFRADAPRAVLFDFARPGNLIVREVAVSSQVKVTVGSTPPYAATPTALHDVRVRQQNVADAGKDWRAHRRFGSAQRALFPDGVSCVDNGRLASILGGP